MGLHNHSAKRRKRRWVAIPTMAPVRAPVVLQRTSTTEGARGSSNCPTSTAKLSSPADPVATKILVATGSAGLLSFAVEVGQLLLPRAPSVVDVLCNTTGALTGAMVGIATHRRFLRFAEWLWRPIQARTTSAVFLAGYFLALSMLLALPLPLSADFIN